MPGTKLVKRPVTNRDNTTDADWHYIEDEQEVRSAARRAQIERNKRLKRVLQLILLIPAILMIATLYGWFSGFSIGVPNLPWGGIGIVLLIALVAAVVWLFLGRDMAIGAVVLPFLFWGIPKLKAWYDTPTVRVITVVKPDPLTRTYTILATKDGSDTIPIPPYYAADWETEAEESHDVVTFSREGVSHVTFVKAGVSDIPKIPGPNKAVAFRVHGNAMHIKVCIHQRGTPCPDFSK